MSLQAAAQHLASRGRGPDTQLVHMAPQEVAGLQALAKAAGGSLTVNPETGLAEAGFLKNLLPTLIGAGLSMIPGVGPLMAAGIVGGGTALSTGSLEKGLMAGLGAYGGAGLAGSLTGAGAAGAAGAGVGSTGVGAGAAPVNYSIMPQSQYALSAPAGIGEGVRLGATEGLKAGASGLSTGTAGSSLANLTTPTITPPAATLGERIASGLGNLGAKDIKYGLAALAPTLQQDRAQEQYKGSGPNPYNFVFDWERPEEPLYDSREALQLRGRLRQLAEGGPVGEMSDRNAALTYMSNGGQMFKEGGETKDAGQGMSGASADALRYLMGQAAVSPSTQAAQKFMASAPAASPTPSVDAASMRSRGLGGIGPRRTGTAVTPGYAFNPATGQMSVIGEPAFGATTEAPLTDFNIQLAGGGLSHLGDYSDGGRLLKGPGDGVSDSIPATIADKRPARLADGEFVVPARIVSELGNGSTDAGARKLYAMMDRIQKARSKTTGKDRVAVNSRADKALPA